MRRRFKVTLEVKDEDFRPAIFHFSVERGRNLYEDQMNVLRRILELAFKYDPSIVGSKRAKEL